MRHIATLLLGSLLLAAAARAQDAPAAVHQESTSFLRRFSLVGRLSIMGRDLLRADKTVISETDYSYTDTTESKSARVGAGPGLEFRATAKLSFSVDYLYHRFGSRRDTKTVTGSDSDEKTATSLEKTRATFWDLPVAAHYQVWQRKDSKTKAFASGGFALRRVTGIHTAMEKTDADGNTCCIETPATPSHRSVRGVIVGAGLHAVDDFGIHVIPELRYIYWLNDTFAGPSAQSRRGELQLLVGFTF